MADLDFEGRPQRFRLSDTDLNWKEWLPFLTMYRILRIRVPHCPPGHDTDCRHSGMYYGMSRQEARDFLTPFMYEVSWHAYLGSK